jgi:hypothetical protein
MIFRVTMKDTDVLHEGITEALDEELKTSGLPEDEQEALRELRHDKASEVASEWFEWGEYLTVEIDTEKQTIRVVPVSEK